MENVVCLPARFSANCRGALVTATHLPLIFVHYSIISSLLHRKMSKGQVALHATSVATWARMPLDSHERELLEQAHEENGRITVKLRDMEKVGACAFCRLRGAPAVTDRAAKYQPP